MKGGDTYPAWARLIIKAAPEVNPVSAFEDFVHMMFLAIIGKPEDARKLPAINGSEERVSVFLKAAEMLGEEMARRPFEDLLGLVHQDIRGNHSQQGTGSFYTPTSLCKAMAELVDADLAAAHADAERHFAAGELYRVLDPTIGAGRTLMSFAEVHREHIHLLRFFGTDIEANAVRMAFVNCTLCGMAAEIRHGNELTGEVWAVYRTPEWYYYEQKREEAHRLRVMCKLLTDVSAPSPFTAAPAPAAELKQGEFDFTFTPT